MEALLERNDGVALDSLERLMCGARARIVALDGRRLEGRIVRFDGRDRVLEVQAREGEGLWPLAFAALRSVELLPGDAPRALPAVRTPSTPRHRKCLVEFNDRGALAMDAATVVECAYGVFIFGPDPGSCAILRAFVPSEAIARYAVGSAPAVRPAQAAANDQGFSITTQDQLTAALDRHRTMRHLRIGDALVQEGLITEKERDDALAVQRVVCHKQLGRILVDGGVLHPDALKRVLREQLGVPAVDLARFAIQVGALAGLEPEVALAYRAIPLRRNGLRMAVALEEPTDWPTLRALERVSGLKVDPVFAAPEAIGAALRRCYGAPAL